MGVSLTISEDSIRVDAQKDLKAVTIMTDTYPGLATDLQQPLTALML